MLGRERGQQAGDRGGLAGARPTGEDARPGARGTLGRRALLVEAGLTEQPVEVAAERLVVRRGSRQSQAGGELVAEGDLEGVVAGEVQQRLLRDEHPVAAGRQRTGHDARPPGGDVVGEGRPRQVGRLDP